MNEIIKDQAKLKKHIQVTLNDYHSAGRRIHIAVVSAFYHAAAYGDPSMLNFVTNGLRSNDQGAVTLFVRRAAAIVGLDGKDPDGMSRELIQAAVEKGGILGRKGGEFFVTKGHTSDEAKLTAKFCEARWINPDGKADKFILDRNNFTETSVIGDSDMLKSIIALAKRLDSDSDTRKVTVSPAVAKFFNDMKDKAEVMLGQTSLADEPKVRTPRASKVKPDQVAVTH
jgi:hypothetical protein